MQGSKFLLAALTGCAALLLNSPLFAAMSVPYGWFVQANAGSTHLSNKSYNGSANTSGIGYSGFAGYKFMPYFAAELGYTTYAETKIQTAYGRTAANDKHQAWTLDGMGILPLGGCGVEAFAKLGVTRLMSHTSIQEQPAASELGIGYGKHSSTGLYIGAGAQYFWLPELGINIQWARSDGNNSTADMDLFSAGVTFIFD